MRISKILPDWWDKGEKIFSLIIIPLSIALILMGFLYRSPEVNILGNPTGEFEVTIFQSAPAAFGAALGIIMLLIEASVLLPYWFNSYRNWRKDKKLINLLNF